MITEPKTKEEFYQMIEERSNNCNLLSANCIGTTKYLTGEAEKDSFSDEPFFFKNNLNESQTLERGHIIEWSLTDYNNPWKIVGTYHVAVYKGDNNVFSRNGSFNVLRKNMSLNKLKKIYGEGKAEGLKINYFIPSKLQKIIDNEGKLK